MSVANHRTPVVGIAGWKNSGKTTMAERLIAELTRRGFVIASVKHAHHSFQIDDKQTDSARHRQAGARQVALVSAERWALMTELGQEREPDLAEVIAMMAPADLIVVEGYKRAAIPKLEVRRQAALQHDPLASGDPLVMAIATDAPAAQDGLLPTFHLDDVTVIADFIVARLNVTAGGPR